jgi:hypothetical protein
LRIDRALVAKRPKEGPKPPFTFMFSDCHMNATPSCRARQPLISRSYFPHHRCAFEERRDGESNWDDTDALMLPSLDGHSAHNNRSSPSRAPAGRRAPSPRLQITQNPGDELHWTTDLVGEPEEFMVTADGTVITKKTFRIQKGKNSHLLERLVPSVKKDLRPFLRAVLSLQVCTEPERTFCAKYPRRRLPWKSRK